MSLLPRRIRDRIVAKKKRLDSHRPLPTTLVAQLRENLLVEYTHSSNAIEGNTLTLGETRLIIEEGVTIGGKSIREHLEARNHPGAIQFVEELAAHDRELKVEDVLRLHGLVLGGIDSSAGKYREWGVRVSGSTFNPPPSHEVPERVVALLDWLRRNPDELTPVELSALLMHRFSQIHPFSDGNGRVGRLLMNLVLIREGYPFITNISYRERGRYLRGLQEADEGNRRHLIGLVARCVEDALDSYLRVIEEPKVCSLSEASRRTGVDSDYLGLLIRRGILPAFKRGGRWFLTDDDLNVYMNEVRRNNRARAVPLRGTHP